MRLDKYLAQMSIGTRSEVKRFIKSGRVFVNDIPAGKPEQKVTADDIITMDGETIEYVPYEYYMLHKPRGYVSAVSDKEFPTVVSLIKDSRREDLFPVGRLDKDTEGLLLITNDGMLAHELLSPKKHVGKTYLVKVQGEVDTEDIQRLENGLDIGDEKNTLPSKVKILETAIGEREDIPEEEITEYTWLELTIQEGRYHQVKRMMAAVGKPVLYLKRLSMGALKLDESLAKGEYRKLTREEIQCLKKQKE
ncbi:MAG: rRNA pseudouridine synthase [Lachnospiraceae bacterium]|nr:rRNA pseudouridine synthase [Lachnospiraceae bacterium]